MSTKSNANLKAVELNQSELNSVVGGNSGMAQAAAQTQANQAQVASQMAQMQAQASMRNAINSMNKSIGSSIKSIGR